MHHVRMISGGIVVRVRYQGADSPDLYKANTVAVVIAFFPRLKNAIGVSKRKSTFLLHTQVLVFA